MKRDTELGKAIKIARIRLGLTQAELEASTGIDFRHVSAIERGALSPRWSTLVKLALALDPYLSLDRAAYATHLAEQDFLEDEARHA